MALTESQIQELYVAYFGRPADVEGKSYWSGSTTGVSTTLEFAANMHSQSEFQDAYGSKKAATQVNQIYQNLFSRDADAAGLEYWTGQIANGSLQLAEIAVHLIWAAKNNTGGSADKTALENKVAAATAFTTDVAADAAAQLAYTADDSNAFSTAKTFIAGVTSTAATAAEIDTQVAAIVSGAGTTGTTYDLKTTADSIVGTDNNDTIKGVISATAANKTFTVLDTIDGGKGIDILDIKVEDDGGGSTTHKFPLITVTNIETVQVRNNDTDDTNTFEVDFNTISGATKAISHLSTEGVTFSNMAAGTDVEVIGNTGVAGTAATLAAGYTSAATSSTLTFSGGVDVGATTITGSKLTSQTIKSTGAQNNIDAVTLAATTTSLTIDASSKFETAGALDLGKTATLTITGSAAVDLDDGTNALDADVITVDGSASTGDIDIELGAVANNTTETSADATVTTGSGNDEISTLEIAETRHFKIDSGAGDDVIYVDQLIGTSSSTAHGDVIDGGAGTDVLSMTSATAEAQSTAATTVSNIEEITISNALASGETVTTKNFQSGISTVNLDGGTAGGTVAFEAGSNNIDIKVANTGTLTVSAAGTATTDSLTISLAAAVDGLDDQSLDLNGIETFTFDTSTATAVTQTIDDIDLTGVSTGGTAKVIFKGSNAITFKSGALVSANELDFSAVTGVVTMDTAMEYIGASGSGTLKGGSKGDTLKGDSGEAMTIEGGAGDDTITGGSAVDTINGGAGDDTINSSAGKDVIDGGAGKDGITVGNALQTIDGGADNDTIDAGTNLQFGQSIKGGAGTDILKVTTDNITSGAGSVVSEFETLDYNDVDGTVDLDNFTNNTFTTVDVGAAAAMQVDSIDSEVILLSSNLGGALALNVEGATSSNSSTKSISLKLSKATILDTGSLTTITNTGTINIESDESDTASGIVHVLDLAADKATKLVITGDTGLDLTSTGGSQDIADVINVDASGLVLGLSTYTGIKYTATFDTIANGTTITGSNGVDTIITKKNTDDTVSLGLGNDDFTYLGGKDTVTGGGGNDTFDVDFTGTKAKHLVITDANKGDKIDLATGGNTGDFMKNGTLNTTLGAAVTLSAGSDETLDNYLAAASTGDGSSTSILKHFQVGGNTYLISDNSSGSSFVDGTDGILEFTGLVTIKGATVSSEIYTLV